jgi:taurine dioxygenase
MGPSPPLTVQRVAGALGAEIGGVDLRATPSPEVAAAIRQALLEHLVVFFRGQDLTPAELLAFASTMGTPVEYPFVAGIPGFPEVIEVAKLEHERVNFGGIWHSDTTYLDVPPMGSMLLAREVPPFGGDTMFANMYLAYETLSEEELLEPCGRWSSSAKADEQDAEDRIRTDGKQERAEYEAVHPAGAPTRRPDGGRCTSTWPTPCASTG